VFKKEWCDSVSFSFSQEEQCSAWELIKKAQSIVLLPHVEADGDARGACAAFEDFLEHHGKFVETVYVGQKNDVTAFAPKRERIASFSYKPDLVISLDTSDPKRFFLPQDYASVPLINIDHHQDNTVKGVYNLVDPSASSTCEILAYLFCRWDLEALSPHAASALLYGILEDSGVFKNSLVQGRTLFIAAALTDERAVYQDILQLVARYKKPFIVRTWGLFLSRLRTIPGMSVVLITLSLTDMADAKADRFALAGFINFVSLLVETDIVLLLVEREGGFVKGSFRSKIANVIPLAARFGGGGHFHAAGFEMQASLARAEELVRVALKEELTL
jgi:phosphoesterase RecJ-like protein